MKIIIILLIIFFSVVVFSGCTQQSNQVTQPQKNSYDGDLCSYLPTRENLTTEWAIDAPCKTRMPADSNNGASQVVENYLIRPERATPVTILSQKFGTMEQANDYLNSQVNPVKQKGGYTEISTVGINANCYGTYVNNANLQQTAKYRCTKGNIYFQVLATATPFSNVDPQEAAQFVAETIANKIQ